MNLYELKTEDFAGLTYACSCGEMHRVETRRILCGKGALDRLVATVEETGANNILFVSARDVYDKYGRSVELLLRKSYRLNVHVFPSGFVPTLLRVAELSKYPAADAVVCFGSGSVADVSKYYCSIKGAPLVAVLTAPCADLSGYCNLMLNGKTERLLASAPYAVVADAELVGTAPPAMIASAFGWIAGTALALFEWKFAYLIGREPYCAELAKFSEHLIRCAADAGEKVNEGSRDALMELTECLLKHAACTQLLGKNRLAESSATLTAAILQAMKEPVGAGSLLGERVLLCANRLIRLFEAALSEDVKLPILPTDKARRASLLAKYCGTDAAETLQRLYDQPKINMELAQYKIREYRRELLGELRELERLFSRINRIFKRMYPDGGFWLRSLKLPNLRTAAYLAPDLSDTFTVLTLLRDEGLLEYVG